MTRKNLRIFLRILIGAVIAVVVSVPADILIVCLLNRLHEDRTGHGGGLYLLVRSLAVVTVVTSFIVLVIKSLIEKKRQNSTREDIQNADTGESD